MPRLDIFSGLIRLIVFYENEDPNLGRQGFPGLFKPSISAPIVVLFRQFS